MVNEKEIKTIVDNNDIPNWSDWLSYYKHLFDRMKQQEDVRDRWFRYYILLLTIPFVAVGLFSKLWPKNVIVSYDAISFIGIIISIIGFLFFLIYNSQRYNMRIYTFKMEYVERKILLASLNDQDLVKRLKNPMTKKNPLGGGDRQAALLYTLVNAALLSLSLAILARDVGNIVPYVVALVVALAVIYLHWKMLERVEKILDETRSRIKEDDL